MSNLDVAKNQFLLEDVDVLNDRELHKKHIIGVHELMPFLEQRIYNSLGGSKLFFKYIQPLQLVTQEDMGVNVRRNAQSPGAPDISGKLKLTGLINGREVIGSGILNNPQPFVTNFESYSPFITHNTFIDFEVERMEESLTDFCYIAASSSNFSYRSNSFEIARSMNNNRPCALYHVYGNLKEFLGPNFSKIGGLLASGSVYLENFISFKEFETLPAWGLAYVYYNQFAASNPVEIGVTQLTRGCLCRTFDGCMSLNDVTVHFTSWFPPDISGNSWTDGTYFWLQNVSSTGVFRCPRALPIERGPSRIPNGWTVEYID